VPDDWRISADEQDGYLTKLPRGFGSPISILKSRLYSMSGSDMEDDPIAKQFSDEWMLRASLKNAARMGPEIFKDPILGPPMVKSLAPGISPEGVANATATPSQVKPSGHFTLGKCPAVDAMGWGSWMPDPIEQSVCVAVHVALGVLAFVAVAVAVKTLDLAGTLAGD
jgi:hypothetical protein